MSPCSLKVMVCGLMFRCAELGLKAICRQNYFEFCVPRVAPWVLRWPVSCPVELPVYCVNCYMFVCLHIHIYLFNLSTNKKQVFVVSQIKASCFGAGTKAATARKEPLPHLGCWLSIAGFLFATIGPCVGCVI